MAFDGNGQFLRLFDWTDDRDAGVKILATRMDAEDDGFATGLSTCLTKDGQTTPTANLPMGGFKHTNVANASSRTQYAAVGQVQDNSFLWGGTDTGAANAYVFSLSPALSAYAAGQRFAGKIGAGNTNTGASTANFGPSAVNVKMPDGSDPIAGALTAGRAYSFLYDGTSLVLETTYTLIGSGGAQAYDATLAALAAVTTAGNKLIYATGSDAFSTTDFTAAARSLLDDADAAAMRATLSAATTAQTDEINIVWLGSLSNRSVTFCLDAKRAGTITQTTTKCVSGTATATWKVNSTALGATNSVSSSEESQTQSSNNTFSAGDDLVLTISANSSCVDLYATVKITRTLS